MVGMYMGEKRMRALTTVAALCAAAVLSLSGCTSAPSPQPSTSQKPSTEASSPAPTPESDPLSTVTELLVRPQALELRNADGAVVQTLDYMSSPHEAVLVLSEVFGGPPSDEAYEGGNHAPGGINHSWNGFVLNERHYDDERRAEQESLSGDGLDYVWPRFAVYFDAPTAHDIALTTTSGLQAGDSWESVAAVEVTSPDGWTCVGTPIDLLKVESSARTTAVVATQRDDSPLVTWVGAPEAITDGCA